MGEKFVALAVVLFMLLASLALTLVGILTDNWYSVEADENTNVTFKYNWTYHYGIWKKCYDTIPSDIPVIQRVGSGGNCVFIYENLIKKDEASLTHDNQLYLHLARSHVAFAIVCGAVQLATILSLIIGFWPGKNCVAIKKTKLYLTAALMLLLATMCGSVSGICFIALRDLDEFTHHIYPTGVALSYSWSFMVHWISTSMCLVESVILLCLLKESYDDVSDTLYNYYNI